MKKKRSGSEDRSGDRWIHDLCNASLGLEDIRKDQPIDIGVKTYGKSHRSQFPHRSISEACAYLCLQDAIHLRKINVASNVTATMSHFAVDSLSPDFKKKLQLLNTLSSILR